MILCLHDITTFCRCSLSCTVHNGSSAHQLHTYQSCLYSLYSRDNQLRHISFNELNPINHVPLHSVLNSPRPLPQPLPAPPLALSPFFLIVQYPYSNYSSLWRGTAHNSPVRNGQGPSSHSRPVSTYKTRYPPNRSYQFRGPGNKHPSTAPHSPLSSTTMKSSSKGSCQLGGWESCSSGKSNSPPFGWIWL